MTPSAAERRVAPRFPVRCVGELASNNTVADVVISDMSVTGCGVELDEALSAKIGTSGVLRIWPGDDPAQAVMLPVKISNQREDGVRPRLGLQFRRLSMVQMRSLIGVLDGMIEV